MKFTPLQKAYFRATDSAYSIVTSEERKKRQITVTETDGESQIAVRHFGECKIPRKANKGKTLPAMVF
jgi:hypothetical protein